MSWNPSNPYSPFPPQMQCDMTIYGNRSNLACCETQTSDSQIRFIFILAKPFINSEDELARRERLVASGFDRSQAYPEIEQLGYMPNINEVYWIYRVEVEIIEKEYLESSDSEIYQEHVKRIEVTHFDSYDACMAHLSQEYGVGLSDFRKLSATSYPKY